MGVWAASAILYDQSWRIDNDAVHQWTAYLAGIVLFLSIGFGPLYVYPRAFFRGASLAERVLASLATPVVWNIKEIIRVSRIFTWGESVYYGLNPLFLQCLCACALQMGLCEIACRRARKGKNAPGAPVVTAGPLLAIALGVGGTFLLFVWGKGVYAFYIFQEGYKALFT